MEQGAPPKTVLILAGPTCSGKSALALDLAQRMGGTIINADSMQVYRELRVLTARPDAAEEALVPHRLYGIRPASEPGSAACWRREALAAIEAAQTPILCGGTGLYLSALTRGIVDIPEPEPWARLEARTLLDQDGAPALHALLHKEDPASAVTLRPSDGQRIARAWEVWRSTGRSLVDWHAERMPPAPYRFRMVLLDPPRDVLRRAIAGRFAAMLEQGALDEVRELAALHLDPGLPAMRAHGVIELLAFLEGRMTLAEAGQRTELVTGQYTKQQATWFRNKSIVDPPNMHTIHARYEGLTQSSVSFGGDLAQFVNPRVD